MAAKDQVKALVFDVFGTVVDWRGTTIRELTSFGNARDIKRDWDQFADDWRGLYQPGMEEVRSGRREFTILDTLHRESLEKLLEKYEIKGLPEQDIQHLVTIWHRLQPWPDVVEGLNMARRERGIDRLTRELDAHGKRLADRAQMAARPMQGRAGVIR